ncbi:hypothetical protein D3C81_1754100 [compost metagenome]
MHRRFGAGHGRLQRATIDDHRLQILTGDFQIGLGLRDRRNALRIRRQRDVHLALRHRTVAYQFLIPAQIRFTLAQLRFAVGLRRLTQFDRRLGAVALLHHIGQRGFLHRQLRQ